MATKTQERTAPVKATAEAAFDKAYQELTPGQRAAVDAVEGPVMVLAGPGTGKTQVLAVRVANILKATQMDPWNILCLTFTESGVVAMRERLLKIMGPAAYQVRVHTFHGFCNTVIQDFPEKFAERSSWQVLTELERVAIIRNIVDGLPGHSSLKPFGDSYLYVTDLITTIAHLKQEHILPSRLNEHLEKVQSYLDEVREPLLAFFALPPHGRSAAACEEIRERLRGANARLAMNQSWQSLIESFFGADLSEKPQRTKLKNNLKRWFDSYTRQLPRQRELVRVFEHYQRELKGRGRYDYADMILSVVERLGSDDELLAYCQEQFQYILVDEYQDTNSSQNEFLKLLGSVLEKPNIFVVGDDKQSIFRFQGASLENLRFFYDWQKENVQVISLTDNFRSQAAVLDAAGAVMAHNQETIGRYVPGVERELKPATQRLREPVQACTYASEEAEVWGVAGEIVRLLEAGVAPPEIAVLYRYNRDAAGIGEALEASGVPARVETPENVLANVQVRQFIQLLRCVAVLDKPEKSEPLLAEILPYQFWELSSLHVLQKIRQAGKERRLLWEVLEAEPEFQPFVHKLATWKAAAANHTVQRLVDIILHESGYLTWVLSRSGFSSALGRLSRLLAELKQLNRAKPELTLPEFLEQLALMQEYQLPLSLDPSKYTADGRVRLMTAHKAKGLEFEHVFIIHLSEKHWGNVQSRQRLPLPHGLLAFDAVEERFSLEDERRLFYVAMTRAKQGLHLSFARRSGEGREQVPAVFWQEIPRELTHEEKISETEDRVAERLRPRPAGFSQTAEDEGVREWLRGQLKSYAMSVTHLNNYLECPRLFYYRNLLRVPAAKTKHMAFGTAVHGGLRDFFQEFSERGEMPGKEFLLDRFVAHLQREVLTETERADSEAVGRQALAAYFARYASEFLSANLLEYDFRPHQVQLGSLRLTGKLDRVEILDAKRKIVSVVDYKTGNPDTAGKYLTKDGKYFRQLVFYKLLTELSSRFPYRMKSGEIDFIQPSKRSGKFVKKKFEISEADVKELTATIQRVWQEIQDLKFLDPNVACGECEYCSRFHTP